MADEPREQAIHAAILNVMSEVKEVVKDSRMDYGDRYQYASIEGFLPTLRESMRNQGLVLYPEQQIESQAEVFTNTQQKVQNRVRTHVRWRMACATDGSSISIESWGEAMDTGDKATNKAATAALKYALVQTFLLPFQDDPDHNSSEEQARGRPSRPRAARQAEPPHPSDTYDDGELPFEEPTGDDVGVPDGGRWMNAGKFSRCNRDDAPIEKGEYFYWHGDTKSGFCEDCAKAAGR